MLKTDVADMLVKKYGKQNPPAVKPGDTIRVHQKIKEGDKERVQIFEGLVIAVKHGNGLNGSFTVRKISSGIGVERTYPLHSPNVVKVERVKTAKVARAKLYYMRERQGKNARFKVEEASAATWQEPEVVEMEVIEEAPVAEEVEETPVVDEATEETPEIAEEPAAEPAAEAAAPEEESK